MIRAMRTEDSPAVYQVLVESLGYTCDPAVVRERIEELAASAHCISLVWQDEETASVTGFIHALRYDTLHDEGGWDVITLGVLPAWQGKGIGKELLAAVEAQVKPRGGSFVRLSSRVERTKAHGFYEHLGYDNPKTQKYFVKRF